MNRPETIEETAELVSAAGGNGVALQVDHAQPIQVQQLIERIQHEQAGRLDVLVNDIWGGDPLAQWGIPFWEHSLENGLRLYRQGLETHMITSWYAIPLMVQRGRGLVVEITDGTDPGYRGSLFYDMTKAGVIRLALGEAADLRPYGVAVVALTPGFLRSEAMLDHFAVTADTWREAAAQDPHFVASETPTYIGRAVTALAADPASQRWSGQALSSGQLARVYGFTDADGTQPDWGRYFAEVVMPTISVGD
jgi:NAD(P)-dependent dehydrogenase (short-subunit alcohol dehydrogenase family)